MTGRGPRPAIRLSIRERNYASPPFDEKLINNGSAAHAWGVISTQTFTVWSMTFYVRTLTFL